MTPPHIPSQKECLNPVMKALHSLGGEASNEQIYNFVVKEFALSAEQLSVPARKGKNEKLNRVAFNINFAKTRLKNAGYLEQPRPKEWKLTKAGKEAKEIDPSEVIRKNNIFYKERNLLNATDDGGAGVTTTHVKRLRRPVEDIASAASHDEIQWLLLSLGNEMKLDLWVASNDRNKSFKDNVFSELPRLRSQLPVQFDQKTQRIIELIDVLWLRGNSIIAAFEIEHTTSIYSGLLRMSDLLAQQPNINIDLFIVAPDDRRDKVKSEINRPTFSKLGLPKRCRYIAYSRLTQKIEQATRGGFLRHLSPSILDELAEDMRK